MGTRTGVSRSVTLSLYEPSHHAQVYLLPLNDSKQVERGSHPPTHAHTPGSLAWPLKGLQDQGSLFLVLGACIWISTEAQAIWEHIHPTPRPSPLRAKGIGDMTSLPETHFSQASDSSEVTNTGLGGWPQLLEELREHRASLCRNSLGATATAPYFPSPGR